jgi:hypothetical protein
MSESILYKVVKPIPELTAEPGDLLIVRPGNRCPFVLQRSLPPARIVLLHTDAVEKRQMVGPADRIPHRPKLELMK